MTDIYAKQTRAHYPRLFFIVFLTFFCGFFAVFCRFFSAFLSVFPRFYSPLGGFFMKTSLTAPASFLRSSPFISTVLCGYGALRRIILNGYALLVKLHGAPAPLALITAVNSKANSAAAFTLRFTY